MSRPSDWYDVFGFGDPTPGEPWEIRQVARRWSEVADDAEYAETTLRGLLGDDAALTWIGQAGDKFRNRSTDLPDQLRKVKDSYRLASEAMQWWAGRLEHHQSGADTQLQRGREAKADLSSAKSKLSSADGQVDGARNDPGLTGLAPTPEQVQAAQDRLRTADAARTAAQGLVDNAQARLDAARALAADAGEARSSDGREAARRVRAAAEAGVPPRSRWERLKDGLADAWSVLVTIAKVVVAVLGVIVLFIGGPLAWIVLAAALILLADALMKYANGEGSLWDVALSALGCIPGFKGLTSLAALSTAFKSGGLLAAGAHLVGSVKAAVTSLAVTAAGLRGGFMPGVRAAIDVLGADGARVLPQLRTTLRDMATAFTTTVDDAARLRVQAYNFQGSQSYPGRDPWGVEVLAPGQRLEVGFPGVGQFAVEGGTAAAHGNQMRGVWESVQVGASPNFGYRSSMLDIQIENPTVSLHGTTAANPHYGDGGAPQYFLDIKEGVIGGNISVFDQTGNPVSIPPGTTVDSLDSFLRDPNGPLGGQGSITLGGPNTPGPGISNPTQVAAQFSHLPQESRVPVAGLGDVGNLLRGVGYVGVGAGLADGR